MGAELVGRDGDLARLIEACSSDAAFVAVIGAPGVGRSRLLDELLLRFDSRGSRSIVVIDHAHFSDDAAIETEVAAARGKQATIVAALDDQETQRRFERFCRPGRLLRLSVEPLASSIVERIGRDMGDGLVDGDDLETAGCDLALLEALIVDRRFGHTPGAGPHVAEVIRRRYDALPAARQRVLETVQILRRVPVSMAPEFVRAELSHLEAAGLVRLLRDAATWWAQVASPTVSVAVEANLTMMRRLEAVAALADAVDPDADWPETFAEEMIRVVDACGIPAPPVIRAVAAQSAFAAFDFETASALATPVATQHWRAAFVLGWIARRESDDDRALSWFEVAASLARTPTAITRTALSVAGLQAWQLLDIEAAKVTVDAAIMRIDISGSTSELRCESAFLDSFLGRFDAAVRSCRDVLSETGLDTLTFWNASICLAYAQIAQADTTDLAHVLLRARDLVAVVADEHPDSADLHDALSLSRALLESDIRSACALLSDAMATWDVEGRHGGMTATTAIDALLLAGDTRAVVVATTAVEHLTRWDPLGTLPVAHAALALAQASSDDLAAARQLVLSWDGRGNDHRALTLLARAKVRAAEPAGVDAAVRDLVETARSAADAGYASAAMLAFVDALWWPSGQDCVEAMRGLEDLAANRQSALAAALGRLATSYRTERVDALETSVAAFLAAGATALAALTLRLLADVYREGLLARRAEARGLAIAASVAPLVLPGPETLVSGGITRREADVALRAAGGASSRGIGEELFVSTRTVDNHLRHVYEKLEVSGREELATLLAPSFLASHA